MFWRENKEMKKRRRNTQKNHNNKIIFKKYRDVHDKRVYVIWPHLNKFASTCVYMCVSVCVYEMHESIVKILAVATQGIEI